MENTILAPPKPLPTISLSTQKTASIWKINRQKTNQAERISYNKA